MPINRIARTLLPTGIAALLVLAGCSSQTDESTTPDAAVPAVELRSELTHLHGLHVGADGTVLAGTHTGIFTIDPSGATSRVGASDDDFMGLTGVPNTDIVFASGHPSASSFAANPLGLRSSTDGGTSWMDRSLAGQVDFHALATDGRVLVGFDGTDGLLVSTDSGTTWAPGARLVAPALAITNSGVWAVTPAGLEHSTTGARTFSPVPGAPPPADDRRRRRCPVGNRRGRVRLAQQRRAGLAETLPGRHRRRADRSRLRHRLRRHPPGALHPELTAMPTLARPPIRNTAMDEPSGVAPIVSGHASSEQIMLGVGPPRHAPSDLRTATGSVTSWL